MSTSTVLGVRLGTTKSVAIASDGELLLTASGGVTWPTMLSFDNKLRLFGEEALPYVSNANTYIALNHLLPGASAPEKDIAFSHRSYTFGRTGERIEIQQGDDMVSATSLVGMFVNKLKDRALTVYNDVEKHKELHFAFAVAPTASVLGCVDHLADVHAHTSPAGVALMDACYIAGINSANHLAIPDTRVTAHAYDAIHCMVAAYARRLNGLRPTEKTELVGKKSLLFHMGHVSTTVLLVEVTEVETKTIGSITHLTLGAKLLCYSHDAALGATDFDDALYAHLVAAAGQKHKSMQDMKLAPGSRRDLRLLAGCERLRKLLSTLPVANATIENLSEEAGDINFSVTSAELSTAAVGLVARLEELVTKTLSMKTENDETVPVAASEISALEMWGGGARMPLAHAVVTKIFGSALPIGAKLEDSSIALGAALLFNVHGAASSTPAADASAVLSSFSPEELKAAVAKEQALQLADRDIQAVLAQRNVLEAFVLESRQRSGHRKHGHLITADNRRTLDSLLDATEDWLYGDCVSASATEVAERVMSLKAEVDALCGAYLEAVAKDKAEVERDLEVQAKLAEAQRVAEGGTDDADDGDDHDNRKLKKPDRLRLVMKNKDEGSELFKGGNFRPACARYQKALTHCSKFFDLSPADEKEITALKVTLYSNLAACYIKLENWDQVVRYTTDAIDLDGQNAKCFFRRSAAWEAKKEWEKALKDAQTCIAVADHADKAFDQSLRRIKKEMDKIKDKEKKMAQKMFK